MKFLKKDGVRLAYEDSSSNLPPILFVHGWGCDHTFLAPQVKHFSKSHRAIAVDLRGHGKSDAPHEEYSMSSFADDLAFLCEELFLKKPVVVGHSMGGNVALEFAARYPDLPSSVVLIDSVILPPSAFIDALRPLDGALQSAEYVSVFRHAASSLFLEIDDADRKKQILAVLPKAPQHVLVPAFRQHVTEYDATAAASGCRVPVAYIGAQVSMVDLARFRSACPQLMTAQTLGAGHFSPLEVPDQINAMLTRFIEVFSSDSKRGYSESPAITEPAGDVHEAISNALSVISSL